MPWRGPETPGEFPTLGYLVADLIEAAVVIPDGLHVGDPFLLTDEQLRFLLFHYRIDPETERFRFDRGSQLVRPQKWGKGPFSAAIAIAEAHPDGPVLFDGWDSRGEPVGRPWPTPHIQITAVSEDQTANVYRALVPMIELGALAADIPDTGLTRINLPSGGLIEPVTASARSRLGQRVTCAIEDQTESWLKRNGGHDLAYNQRRGLAGMGGRFISTPNAWDPTEDSTAQRTAESRAPGVYHDDVEPGPGSVRNKVERRRMLRRVYCDSAVRPRRDTPEPWVDLDRIDSEIVSLLEEGEAAQAERWFLNRKQAGESAAFDHERWDAIAAPREVPHGDLIAIGVDGARFIDALAIVATHVDSGYQWPLIIEERPKDAGDEYEHDAELVDGAMIEAFKTWSVWRAYVDPQHIDHLLNRWQGRWGKRVQPWFTNRPRQACWMVRNFTTAINAAANGLTHDGDPVLTSHIRNAKKRREAVKDDKGREMHTICKDGANSPRSIDGAIAAALSWECRGDCIADGAQKPRGRAAVFI